MLETNVIPRPLTKQTVVLRVLTALSALCLLVSCSGLSPYEGPKETTPPPVTRGIWADIQRIQPDHWQVPLNDGRTALEWRLRAIDSAMQSIDFQSFIWSFDAVGSLVQQRLLSAADRGVLVRILIDDSFLLGKDQHLLELHHHENVEYRIYNPYKRRSNGAVSRLALNLGEFERLDHRMHNKSLVIDNQIAIIGGRNIANEYFGFGEAYNFRDMELLVGGPVVEDISASFDDYWNDQWSFPVDAVARVRVSHVEETSIAQGAAAVDMVFGREAEQERRAEWLRAANAGFRGSARLIADEPPRDTPQAQRDRPVQVADEIAKLIRGAREEIVIVSAYLIPTPGLVEAMREASEKGVRVRLLTNSINSNNHLAAYSVYVGHIRELLGLGAEIHEMRVTAPSRSIYMFPPILRKTLGLHAKYMVIDGRQVVVGSANLDPRSLRINTEMVLLVENRRLAQRLLDLTQPDFNETNAWRLSTDEDGKLLWIGEDVVLDAVPARSSFQKLEEWFFAHLPIEDEL